MNADINTKPASASSVNENEIAKETLSAVVQGKTFTKIPKDLYIPADALLVFLESFEGPLDLLLYLIQRQGFDVLSLPVADITAQYMQYIDKMQELRVELAADYLVMASMLAEIKSRMLLPRPSLEEEEEDPRAELARRLLEYQRFKDAAERFDSLPRLERDLSPVMVPSPSIKIKKTWPRVEMEDIVIALNEVSIRAEFNRSHRIVRESLSIRERISYILLLASSNEFVLLGDCFTAKEGRGGVVVTLLALLELMRSNTIEVVQVSLFSPIRIYKVYE